MLSVEVVWVYLFRLILLQTANAWHLGIYLSGPWWLHSDSMPTNAGDASLISGWGKDPMEKEG